MKSVFVHHWTQLLNYVPGCRGVVSSTKRQKNKFGRLCERKEKRRKDLPTRQNPYIKEKKQSLNFQQ